MQRNCTSMYPRSPIIRPFLDLTKEVMAGKRLHLLEPWDQVRANDSS